jgi:excisionase family DNA binding protein
MTIAERIEAYDHALTAQELSAILGCSPTYLYNAARDGKVPHIRLGTSIRFDPEVTAAWVRAQACGKAA